MFGRLGCVERARQIFDAIADRDSFSWGIMLSIYARSGDLSNAKGVFDRMPRWSLGSWTALLSAFALSGHHEEAKTLFDTMQERDLIAWTIMLTVLATFSNIEDAKYHFDQMPERDLVAWTAMLAANAERGQMENARETFDQMPERNLFSWTSLLSAYGRSGDVKAAGRVFDSMPEWNLVAWTAMLTGYSLSGDVVRAKRAFDSMPERDLIAWTAMLSAYAFNGHLRYTREIFQRMPERDLISWATMVAALVENDLLEESKELFDRMPRHCALSKGMTPNRVTFITLLDACSFLGALAEGRKIHAAVAERGFDTDLVVSNALVNFYGRCGALGDAKIVFDGMRRRDVISWSSMISAFAQRGRVDEAMELYHRMLSEGTLPDDIIFISVLFACSNSGVVEASGDFFRSIVGDTQVEPTLEHYACMVDVLGRAGKLRDAEDLLRLMPFHPGPLLYMTMLSACKLYTDVERGEAAAEVVFELDPENSSPYITLANIYSAAKRPKDAARIRKLMEERGIKKKPGCSWIEVLDRVHEFIAGDKMHPQRDEIYAEIQRLGRQMKEAGYFQDTKVVLQDVEEDEKENLLWYHSEKLAIAFGLISTPPGAPLRIVKNLRVCSDCHAATKVISKVTGREILVRDTNRFHHFQNGMCSCNDYW
ncbi:hypothetical protein SELMODRAFT_107192 [Selaginella moellendorffii]|uniref:DYW domain-containing protein n=1 Tax=Selaginella moellendorffii TaxID=88036 RepID=D8S1W0_SELML|nr:hypothetical protein SELMODRAFT_107192 [Selaginella moellendorffii]